MTTSQPKPPIDLRTTAIPGCYHVLFNEDQRLVLIEVLGRTTHESIEDDMILGLWIDMLCDLPSAEAEDPGILHGFCL